MLNDHIPWPAEQFPVQILKPKQINPNVHKSPAVTPLVTQGQIPLLDSEPPDTVIMLITQDAGSPRLSVDVITGKELAPELPVAGHSNLPQGSRLTYSSEDLLLNGFSAPKDAEINILNENIGACEGLD